MMTWYYMTEITYLSHILIRILLEYVYTLKWMHWTHQQLLNRYECRFLLTIEHI